MSDSGKRIGLYTITSLILGAMIYGGFVYEAEPEYGTLLSSADVHSTMARNTPVGIVDEDGRDLRANLIRKSKSFLERAERQLPGTLGVLEQRAYLFYLEGNYEFAAKLYGESANHAECPQQQADGHILNRIRLLRRAGKSELALEEWKADSARFMVRSVNEGKRLHCRLLSDLGRNGQAARVAMSLCEPDPVGATACVEAGNLLEELGEMDAAEAAYTKASQAEPLANYYIARLKVRIGAFDTALDLLKTSLDGAASDTLSLLDRDVEDWQACSRNRERFQKIRDSVITPASPR